MPAGFDRCRAQGGRIRTKELGGGRYMHICFLNGKSYAGEVKTKSTKDDSGGSNVAAAIKKRMGK